MSEIIASDSFQSHRIRKGFLALVMRIILLALIFSELIYGADELAIETVRGPQTVLIKGGAFLMGAGTNDQASITVRDFRIAITPVTADEFCKFLNSMAENKLESIYFLDNETNNSFRHSPIIKARDKFIPREGVENCPSNRVTWKGAVEYSKWLSKIIGKRYRLPTDAEWEYAARGKEGRLWPWGNQKPDETRGNRWIRKEYDEIQPWKKPAVGSFPAGATPDGVLDMMGCEIGEWCSNKYARKIDPNYATNTELDEYDLDSHRVIRGLHYYWPSLGFNFSPFGEMEEGKTWTRVGEPPISNTSISATYGFRLVEEVEEMPVSQPSDSIPKKSADKAEQGKQAPNAVVIVMGVVGIMSVILIVIFRRRNLKPRTRD